MPYVSDAQRKFMHAKHPGIAKRWDKEYPDQKGLPEHVDKKASLEQRLLISSVIKIASQVKRGGVMDLVSQLGGKVGPMLHENVTSPLLAGLRNIAGGSLGGAAAGVASKAVPHLDRASGYLGNAGLPLIEAPNAARNIGLATLGAGGALAANGVKNRMMGGDKEAAAIGTPYTDGIVSWCLTNHLDANQVLDVFEKGASQEGKTGQECKAFLDRLLAE